MLKAMVEIFNYCKASDEQINNICWNPENPRILERKIVEGDSYLTKLSKKRLPLFFAQTTEFTIYTTRRLIHLTLNPFNYDGATYPKVFNLILGKGTKKQYRIASAVHDYLMNNRAYVLHNVLKDSLSISEFRRLTSLIFRQILIEQKVNKIQAYSMSFLVQVYQTLFNRKKWKEIKYESNTTNCKKPTNI